MNGKEKLPNLCLLSIQTFSFIPLRVIKKLLISWRKTAAQFFIFRVLSLLNFLSYPLIDEETIIKFRAFVYQTNVIDLDIRLAELRAGLRRKYNLKIANSRRNRHYVRDFKKVKEFQIFKI